MSETPAGTTLSEADRKGPVDVLNGIAYDAKSDRLFVTGKLWPRLFEIKLVSKTVSPRKIERKRRS